MRGCALAGIAAGDYFDGPMRGNVIDGRTWGIPWYADTRLLFYRSDLLRAAGFAAPPRDWAGWLAAMRAVKARAGARRLCDPAADQRI